MEIFVDERPAARYGDVRVTALALALALIAVGCSAGISAPPRWQGIHCDAALGSPAAAGDDLRVSRDSWKTDFSRHCVPLSEIASGGPPRDAITPLDAPGFVGAGEAAAWLEPQEPVIVVADGALARAYPLQILIWHEIANDTIGGRPIVVTFCPLCNTSLVFDRRVGGRELTFGTTGNLRLSDLVMWDRQSESWWQQATGEAIVGDLTGSRLERIRSSVLSFGTFRSAHPEGQVLSRDAANTEMDRKGSARRAYGANPYIGYDRTDSSPISAFWGDRPIDARLHPKTRVAVATFASPPVAYVLDDLKMPTALNDTIAGRRIVLLFAPGVSSPLDRETTAAGTDIGQATMFDASVDGRALTLHPAGPAFTDEETGSSWSITGVATAGRLAGTRLRAVDHDVTFWFIWSVFRPDTEIRRR